MIKARESMTQLCLVRDKTQEEDEKMEKLHTEANSLMARESSVAELVCRAAMLSARLSRHSTDVRKRISGQEGFGKAWKPLRLCTALLS